MVHAYWRRICLGMSRTSQAGLYRAAWEGSTRMNFTLLTRWVIKKVFFPLTLFYSEPTSCQANGKSNLSHNWSSFPLALCLLWGVSHRILKSADCLPGTLWSLVQRTLSNFQGHTVPWSLAASVQAGTYSLCWGPCLVLGLSPCLAQAASSSHLDAAYRSIALWGPDTSYVHAREQDIDPSYSQNSHNSLCLVIFPTFSKVCLCHVTVSCPNPKLWY